MDQESDFVYNREKGRKKISKLGRGVQTQGLLCGGHEPYF